MNCDSNEKCCIDKTAEVIHNTDDNYNGAQYEHCGSKKLICRSKKKRWQHHITPKMRKRRREKDEWIYDVRIHQIYKRNSLNRGYRQSQFYHTFHLLQKLPDVSDALSFFYVNWIWSHLSCSLESIVNMTLLNPPYSFYTALQSLIFGGLLFRLEFICMSDV